MVDDYGDYDYMESGNQGPDASVRNFYEKLSDLPQTWIPLEDVHYRINKMGPLALG